MPNRYPTPTEQVRVELQAARARGESFEDASEPTLRQKTHWPHDTAIRRAWREALAATRDEWRAAYYGWPTRAAAVLASLAEQDPDADWLALGTRSAAEGEYVLAGALGEGASRAKAVSIRV